MPKYVIIAGINGAGKSTLFTAGFERYVGEAQFNRVNPDEELKNFDGDYHNAEDVRKSGKLSVKKLESFVKSGVSFNQETTLSGQTDRKKIARIKAAGYQIVLLYVGLDSVETAVKRVKSRVAKGGHDISSALIAKRYPRSLSNLTAISDLVDVLHIFDNTDALKEVYFRNEEGVILDETKAISWLTGFEDKGA